MGSPTDHDVVLRAAAFGDDQALEVLVRAYHDRVYRFGLRVCRDPFDADDAVQDAFVALSRRPDVIRDRGALSWLMTVVRNACLRMLRPWRLRRAPLGDPGSETDVASTEIDPEAALERWRLMHRVHQAIAALDPSLREVLVLRDLEGQPGQEVADSLGLSTAAMKSRLHRARAEIRERLTRLARADEGN
jgi:RNA polymerase sigma-70 factor (ECF subfamily)